MANSAELVIRVLADTTAAHASFASLGPALAGIGIGGAVGAGGVAVLQVAADYQSAMAIVQSANNSLDFAPGTSKYEAASKQINKTAVELATSQNDVAESYAQATRFIDEQGQHLSPDKINEYTDATIRLAKVSTDHISALQAGQDLDVFEKLYGKTNFAQVGAELAGLSNIHNQGEAITMATAIPLAQYGAQMGVSQEQSLGVATYLADRGAGGGMAGMSIGRMFQRMDESADNTLDPEVRFATTMKNRNAQERLADLQTSLAEANAKHDEMFGQHGLKTQYKNHPSEVMAEEDRRAKLQREIADQQEIVAHLNDAKTVGRGKMDVEAMAKTAGMDATDYANLVKENPMDALIAFTTGVHNLPASERSAAERAAGLTQFRDVKTVNTLSAEPDTLQRILAEANDQRDNPTALQQRSDIMLGTAQQHLRQLEIGIQNDAAGVGAGPLGVVDAGVQKANAELASGNLGDLAHKVLDNTTNFDNLNGILSTAMPFLGPMLTGLIPAAAIALKGGGAAAVGNAVTGAAGAAGGGALALAGGLGAGAGLAYLDVQRDNDLVNKLNDARKEAGLAPVQMSIGPFHVGDSRSGEEMFDIVKRQFVAAWDAAQGATSVPVGVGGNMAPR